MRLLLIISTLFSLSTVFGQVSTISEKEIEAWSEAQDSFRIIRTPEDFLQNTIDSVVIETVVLRTFLSEKTSGKPIYLDVFAAYPDSPITIAIFEEHQSKFLPYASYNQKKVRITGVMKDKDGIGIGKKSILKLKDASQLIIIE